MVPAIVLFLHERRVLKVEDLCEAVSTSAKNKSEKEIRKLIAEMEGWGTIQIRNGWCSLSKSCEQQYMQIGNNLTSNSKVMKQ